MWFTTISNLVSLYIYIYTFDLIFQKDERKKLQIIISMNKTRVKPTGLAVSFIYFPTVDASKQTDSVCKHRSRSKDDEGTAYRETLQMNQSRYFKAVINRIRVPAQFS